jgi:hypothetical protein
VRSLLFAGVMFSTTVLFSGCATEDPTVTAAPPSSSAGASSGGDGRDEAAQDIVDVFENYRTHLLNKNGSAVPALLSPATIGHYDRVSELARTAGPQEIASAAIMDRIMIARLRTDMPRDQLATLTGAELLRYGVDNDMIDSSSVAGAELGDVRVEADRGYAEMIADSVPTGVDWEFARADRGWTLDLAASFPLVDETLRQAAREAEMTEDEFVLMAVSMVSDNPVDASVFDKP